MKQEQNIIENEPYVGMLIYMVRDNCTYVIERMSDKRVYMKAVGDFKRFGNQGSGKIKTLTRMFSNIPTCKSNIKIGVWKIVETGA
jgi:hypothetical protein